MRFTVCILFASLALLASGETVRVARDVPVGAETDVLVVGGGPAGVAAAVTAAEAGRRVLLIEQTGSFGGAGTVAGVAEIMNFDDGVHFLAGGFGRRVYDALFAEPKLSRRWFNVKTEDIKRLYDKLVKASGADFRFYTRLTDVVARDGRVTHAIVSDPGGTKAVAAKVFVDATGSGFLCHLAGVPCDYGDGQGHPMAATLCSVWGGVDFARKGFSDARFTREAHAAGVLSQYDTCLPGIKANYPEIGVGFGNVGHVFAVDDRDAKSLTDAMVRGRSQLAEYERYYRTYVPGCTAATLVRTADWLGVRASRRVRCEKTLTIASFREQRPAPDEIGRYSYPIDIHPVTADAAGMADFEKSVRLCHGPGESYGIPYGALVPVGIGNLLVAGRAIGADNAMQASVRVIPGCYITGQAAGLAAALAVERGCATRDVPTDALRARLRAVGAYLGEAAPAAPAALRLEAGKTQVYVADGSCAVARYAGGVLGTYLAQILGGEVPVTNVFLAGRVAISVGDNASARAAGIDVGGLARDAGVIRTDGNRVYIAGSDDPVRTDRQVREALRAGIWANFYERATEFAVYEFLERYAGMRFYFPGRLGTIVPKRPSLEIPVGVVTNAPDYAYRDYALWETGDWYEDETRRDGRGLVHHTHRLHTEFIPCSHGLNEFSYLARFGKTHPEYFQLMEDGRRNVDPKFPQPGQLCHSSKIWDEIYEDVKSYFLGEPPEKRGILAVGYPGGRGTYGWNCNTRTIKGLGKFADVMPQDAFRECRCEKCQKAYRKEKGASYATDLVWGNVTRLCNRLKAEGVAGTVTMMGYSPYKDPPEGPLPDNLRVMVARGGPWNEADPAAVEREKGEIRAWAGKIGRKVWLWNYPCKFRGEFPAIPEHCPHAWAKYYQSLSPVIFGAFAQNTTTQFLYTHLNAYVYSRICWNNAADVDAILEEYYTLMYGGGRDEMKAFFETLEAKWMRDIVGKMVDTPLGPVPTQPSDYEMFNRIYSPDVLKRLAALLDAAARKAGAGTVEAERVRLMRRVVFAPMAKRAADYLALTDVRQGLARRAARGAVRNIVANGGFDAKLDGWLGRGEIVRGTAVTGGGCVKVVSADPKGGGIYQMLNRGAQRLKPNTKYRLSYFVRYENVVPAKKGGGVYSNVWTEGQNWYPVNHCGHTGTAGWIYQEQVFTSRPEKGEYGGYDACSISLSLRDATGTAWFDDVVLEELAP